MEAKVASQGRKSRARRTAEEGVCQTLFVDEKKCTAVEARMLDGSAIEEISEVFGVLADPTRLRIVFALSLEELCVCDLARIVGRSMPATSHQLRLLRKMHVVKYRTDGKLVYYTLTSAWVRRLIEDAVRQADGEA